MNEGTAMRELQRAARKYRRSEVRLSKLRNELYSEVRLAYNGGVPKLVISRVSGLARATVQKVLRN